MLIELELDLVLVVVLGARAKIVSHTDVGSAVA
jgi:hypothetical protein